MTDTAFKKTSGKTIGKDDWQGGASGRSKGGKGKVAKDGWENGSTGGSKGVGGKTAKDGWQSGGGGISKGSGKTRNDNWQSGASPQHKTVVKGNTLVEGGKTVNPQPGSPKSDQPK